MDTLEISEEKNRIKELGKFQILDTPPDGSFDRLTSLAAKLFNVPIAIVSLVDENRIWFKSHHGLEIDQIDREPGLCASAICSKELYLVENAIEDVRTLANPLVAGEFGLRFYAAAPLITKDGYCLGTFCIIDKKQRFLNDAQKQILQDLSQIVIDDMELRLSVRNSREEVQDILGHAAQHLKETISNFSTTENENVAVINLLQDSKNLLSKIDTLSRN